MSKEPQRTALIKQLKRRPDKTNLSWVEVGKSGAQILNLTLMALAGGAADGLAELGDPKAYKPSSSSP